MYIHTDMGINEYVHTSSYILRTSRIWGVISGLACTL